MTGPDFRDYHLLLDEQSDQIFAMTDPVAERARKLGGITLYPLSKSLREHHLSPKAMLGEPHESSVDRISPFHPGGLRAAQRRGNR
jgi:DNA-binding ferritin-like protein